jgi:hypothetical protein
VFCVPGQVFFIGDCHLYQHIKVPAKGEKIVVNPDMSLTVPDQPIIPYIEGDGTGLDINPVIVAAAGQGCVAVDAVVYRGQISIPTQDKT